MNFKVIPTPTFAKSLKALAKRYRSMKARDPPSCREEYTADLSGADPADCALYVCGDERAVQSGGSSDAVSGFPGKGQGDDQRGFLYPAKQYP